MSKSSNIIGMAASGIASRSFHSHWPDCNPLKPQHITMDEVRRETHVYIRKAAKSRERIARAILDGARILY